MNTTPTTPAPNRSLPDDNTGDLEQITTAAVQREQVVSRAFAGPLPPPEILEHYQRIQPNLVERLIQLTEQEAVHRRQLERVLAEAAAQETTRGQHYGLIIALAALTVSALSLFLGYEKAAMTIGGTTVIGLATVFVVGRWKSTDQ